MSDRERGWVSVATFAAGYEADIAIARLDAAGIVAVRQGNDTVGLFGPGFEGPTARGVDVLVPRENAAEAREILSESDGEPDPPM